MLIDTKKLTTKQLIKILIAITDMTHQDVADAIGINVHTLRDKLRKEPVTSDSTGLRALIELVLITEINK